MLGWLLGHADEAYYLRELVRHTGGAVGAVQRELEQLTAAGLVCREVRGKQVYFQANQKAAIFPELQGLFAKTAGLVDILREALTRSLIACRRHSCSARPRGVSSTPPVISICWSLVKRPSAM